MDKALLLLAGLVMLTGCQVSSNQGEVDMSQQFVVDLETLKQVRIFFAHQSVGENIIDGLQALASQSQTELALFDLEGFVAERRSTGLVHTPIGKNQQPLSKCEDFERIIDQELAGKIDYALLKFCYIDVNRESDVATLFDGYKSTMDRLIKKYPDITFIHTTMPLRHSPGGFGVWIREIIGRPNNSKLDNQKRNQFNHLLLETYGTEQVVDIARAESTYPDGRMESFSMAGERCQALIGDYTSDGGHLNELGRRQVAQAFAQDLARIIRASK